MPRYFPGLFALLLLVTPQHLVAERKERPYDPLREVNRSRVFQKAVGSKTDKANWRRIYTDAWFNPATFYGQLFLRDKGYLMIWEWLGLPNPDFAPGQGAVNKKTEFLEIDQTYLSERATPLRLKAVIVHPRSYAAAEEKLIPQLNAMYPAPETIEAKEKLSLEGDSATIYALTNGTLLAVLDEPKLTTLFVTVDTIKQRELLTNFLKRLNLGLLKTRLNS